MQVKDFLKMDVCKKAKSITFRGLDKRELNDKPMILLEILNVIGSEHDTDGNIVVDVNY